MLPQWLSNKQSVCNAEDTGDTGLIPGLGRSAGGEHDNPLQCSCLENLIVRRTWECTVHRVTESDTTEAPEHARLRFRLLLLLSHFSHVQLCATPWTAAHQAPLSMGFSRQEYWSELIFCSPRFRLPYRKFSYPIDTHIELLTDEYFLLTFY